MGPTVKLRLGDLFEGPADLIVLPCSTAGTVTGFVARSLVHHSIPHPRQNMALGEVEIMPFDGADDIAQYVAFAASVHGYGSSIPAIKLIGEQLGDFTQTLPSVRTVSAPLLGSGAGGLAGENVVDALRTGFCATAAPDASLAIHVLQREVYDRIKDHRRAGPGERKGPIRVFISHTSKTDDAARWVQELALYLNDQGLQPRLDYFHLRRGMDLPQWMCNELAMARKVVIICDEAYKQRADGRLGGVGWETMIIQGDIAALPPDSTKYQVVVRADDIDKGLPMYLKTRYVFHAPTTNETSSFRAELVKELLDLPIDPTLEAKECTL